MKALTGKQKAIIEKNLKAFTNNFGEVRIERAAYGNGFYVFYPTNDNKYIHYCDCIHYLNGWLYGVVQAGIIKAYQNKDC